jgi:sec-independent protein translocase protein TatB
MFDIGFSELLLIGVVALIVIGPERLPKVARMAGAWMGRLNRYVSQVKQEVEREMKLEELRNLQQEMKDTAQKYEVMAKETAREVDDEVRHVTKEIADAGAPAAETPQQAPDGSKGGETVHASAGQADVTKQVSGPQAETTAVSGGQHAHDEGSAAAPGAPNAQGQPQAKAEQPEKHDPPGSAA